MTELTLSDMLDRMRRLWTNGQKPEIRFVPKEHNSWDTTITIRRFYKDKEYTVTGPTPEAALKAAMEKMT